MSDEKLTFGAILGFVGGLVILVYGAFEIYLGETFQSITSIGGFPVQDVSLVVDAGTAGVVLGFLIMVCSVLLAGNSNFHVLLGTLVILFSLVSLVSLGGGNGVGFLLGVIGGACGIAFGEEPYVPPLRTSPVSTTPWELDPTMPGAPADLGSPSPESEAQVRLYRGCTNCGKTCLAAFTICPNCGARF